MAQVVTLEVATYLPIFQYACYDVIGLLDDRRGNLQCIDNFVSLESQKVMKNSIAIELVN